MMLLVDVEVDNYNIYDSNNKLFQLIWINIICDIIITISENLNSLLNLFLCNLS